MSLQALRWSWTLVIACGLLLGYYCLQTYGLPRHRQYQLEFGKAEWIEPAESPAPIAYFRKEIYLSSLPAQAWIEIAASDNFGLVVNGHTIGNLGSDKDFRSRYLRHEERAQSRDQRDRCFHFAHLVSRAGATASPRADRRARAATPRRSCQMKPGA